MKNGLVAFEKSSIQSANPYATFFMGDFNGHSQSWWADGDTTPEGRRIDELLNSLNLSQLISEPTNFTPSKKPSCIDLLITDQPNLMLDYGVRPSLDPKCHHQIIHSKINIKIPPPPPVDRHMWYYDKANADAIRRSMTGFPWAEQFLLNNDVNWQVKTFHETLLNIMKNFIPNHTKKCIPRDPPWIHKPLKTLLKKKNRLYQNYKKHGYKNEDKERLDSFRDECKEAIDSAKLLYLNNLGSRLNSSDTTPKNYWKIIHRAMNKSRAPKIPPILNNGNFVLKCTEKAKLFNEYFAKQCTLIINDCALPNFEYRTEYRINSVSINDDDILKLIRNLNPNKASDSNWISGQMLLICDISVILPVKIMYKNILATSFYPDMWKLANVTQSSRKRINN